MYKGAKGLDLDETSIGDAFAWALGLGGGIGLLMIPTVLPYMRRQIGAKFNEDGTLKPVSFRVLLYCCSPKTLTKRECSRNMYDSPGTRQIFEADRCPIQTRTEPSSRLSQPPKSSTKTRKGSLKACTVGTCVLFLTGF